MKSALLSFIFLFVLHLSVYAQKVKTQAVSYKDGDTELEGYLAYDPAAKGKRPAVIVVHEWTGINEYTRKRCEQLAAMGYIAFAADVYGKGIRPSAPQDAGRESAKYRNNRPLMRQRMKAALDWAKKQSNIDSSRIAAIGYCFGGTAVLELARSGATLAGVVSFHGGLSTPNPQDASNIRSKVLICHGAIDPFVPQEEVDAFMKAMNDAKVDYQFIAYSNAMHSFTNPEAMSFLKGVAYNEEADKRSWEAMKLFFSELFR